MNQVLQHMPYAYSTNVELKSVLVYFNNIRLKVMFGILILHNSQHFRFLYFENSRDSNIRGVVETSPSNF